LQSNLISNWKPRPNTSASAVSGINVNVIIRRGRVIDQDNAQACLKSLIDGLFNNAVTPNDSRKWVLNYTVNQETGRVWQYQPEVEFIVEVNQ
jgi:hypothetical protein